MSLSACLIVRDEERFLDRCLRSLHGIADQICVLDTGSTDGTMRIAREHGATVSTFDWDDDFAAARNACLTLAKGDWILQVDADEELVQASPEQVRQVLSDPGPCRLVELELRGDGGRSERTWQPRLFRRDSGLRYRRALHETILDELAERGLPSPRPCPLLLIHHGYTGELVASRAKIERNRRILRKVRDRGQADAYDLFKLASALDAGDDASLDAERTETWRSCISSGWSESVNIRLEWPWWSRACRAAATHLWRGGHVGEGLDALRRLRRETPDDPDARRALALAECRAGRPGEGLRILDANLDPRTTALCLEAARDFPAALDAVSRCGSEAPALRARILAAAGNGSEAVRLLEASFTSLLEDPEAGYDAAVAFSRMGESALARNILSRPLAANLELHAERAALSERLSAPKGKHPIRDIHDAARTVLADVLGGQNPSPLDPGFHLPAVRDVVADLLEDLLARGDEESVRRFAAASPRWERILPGISRLIEGC